MNIPLLIAKLINEDPDDLSSINEMTPKELFNYVVENGVPWPEAEPIIMKDPETAAKYAKVFRGRWPEAEPIIMKAPYWAYYYARDVLHHKRWPEAEPYIMRDPRAAAHYANGILHKEWPEAEPYIKKDPLASAIYAARVLHRRWPEAEPIIIKNPRAAAAYAKDIFHGPWPEAEPYIIKNPQAAYTYASMALKERWPEAEPIIMKDPQVASYYASNVLKEPWPEAEPIIIKDPHAAYYYVSTVLKKPWPEAEPIIMKDSMWANSYARDILKRPWPEAEPIIKKDPWMAYYYAEDVLHGKRFPEAEPYIMKKPFLAYLYVKNILKRPWPEAEPYIKRSKKLGKLYDDFLKTLKISHKKVNKSNFFKHGYEARYLIEPIPASNTSLIKDGRCFTLVIGSLEPDVERAIPKELYSLMDLHGLGSKNKINKFIGWIGGTITDDAMWVQEVQSDLLQRTWQLQSKDRFINKKNRQLKNKKELLNQLQDELNKLLDYYQHPPLSKAYGLEEKIEYLKQEQEKLKREIKNAEENKRLEFHPEYSRFRSRLENLYLKWIEAFYHIVIWYAKKLNINKLYIIPSETVASLWDRDVGGEGSVYYRAYDGIAKKLGAKLVTIDNDKWWLLELDSFTPMESKNHQK